MGSGSPLYDREELRVTAVAALANIVTQDFEAVTDDAVGKLAQGVLDLLRALEEARKFANLVLECDAYGCESGPDKCLHADARRFLGSVGESE